MPSRRLSILAPLKTWGGIERKMLILCREFLAAGVEVEFLLTRGGQVPYPEEFPSAVRIVDLMTRGKLDTIPRLIRHLRESRPDALLTAKDHAAKAAILARLLGGPRVPVFIKVTNTLSHTMRRSLKRHMARWLYPLADGVIANSHGVAEDLNNHFGLPSSRVEVIFNPTVTPDFPERAGAPVDHPWFIDAAMPVLVAAGRLSDQKDFPTLLRALALVRMQRPCRLVILGEGERRRELDALAHELGIADALDLPGYVADPLPYMARAAVFVLSSRYEGLPNVLIEAMAVGTPVVATDCPSGPAEILDEGRYGPLVPMDDPQAMAAGILQMLDRPPQRSILEAATERFRSDVIGREYLRVLGLDYPSENHIGEGAG
ncbi:MAG: glycosyltransferase [Aquisalimonadaceae bacterium]